MLGWRELRATMALNMLLRSEDFSVGKTFPMVTASEFSLGG